MAHFYGRIKGRGKSESTQCGTKSTGLRASADGWDLGCTAYIFYNELTQRDEVRVTIDSGSGYGESKVIGTFYKTKNGKIRKVSS